MDINFAYKMARSEMDKYGLQDWTFAFDRSVNRLGVCKYLHKIISLSKPLTKSNSEERVLNTIRHEIAHALVGWNIGHGRIWVEKAQELGCDGKRSPNAGEFVRVASKYSGICTKCGYDKFERNRKTPGSQYTHRGCLGVIEWKKK